MIYREEYWFYSLSQTARRKLHRSYRKFCKKLDGGSAFDFFEIPVYEVPDGHSLITLSELIEAQNLDESIPVHPGWVLEWYEILNETGKFPGVIRVEKTPEGLHILSGHELLVALAMLVLLYDRQCLMDDSFFWREHIVDHEIPVLVYQRVSA